jgi:Mn2+/Fe2+ NRAMP family transporter
MAVSNVVALAIITSTAATLHPAGKTEIATAADVAEALRPLAGEFAFFIFRLGIIGTGLLSLPFSPVPQPTHLGRLKAGNAVWKTSLGKR